MLWSTDRQNKCCVGWQTFILINCNSLSSFCFISQCVSQNYSFEIWSWTLHETCVLHKRNSLHWYPRHISRYHDNDVRSCSSCWIDKWLDLRFWACNKVVEQLHCQSINYVLNDASQEGIKHYLSPVSQARKKLTNYWHSSSPFLRSPATPNILGFKTYIYVKLLWIFIAHTHALFSLHLLCRKLGDAGIL